MTREPAHSPDLAGASLLVTGANGFLGANTAAFVSHGGARVVGADLPRTGSRGERIRASLGVAGIGCLCADLTDPVEWGRILERTRPDAILHLAGATARGRSRDAWIRCFEGNLVTTSAMVRGLIALPRPSRPVVVYPGSQMEYGTASPPWTEETRCRPANPYATTKLMASELLIHAARSGLLRACTARLPLVYGAGQPPTMFIPELVRASLRGQPFEMTEGTQRRRFLAAGDAARFLAGLAGGLLAARELPPLLNAPAAEPVSMREVAERIGRHVGGPVEIRVGALPMRADELRDAWPDDTKARALGFSDTTPLEAGLQATVDWYRANPWFLEESP